MNEGELHVGAGEPLKPHLLHSCVLPYSVTDGNFLD